MTYTNEQIEEAAKAYEGYGEPVVPAMLRAWIAERKRKMVVTDKALDAAVDAGEAATGYRIAIPYLAMNAALDAALKEMQK